MNCCVKKLFIFFIIVGGFLTRCSLIERDKNILTVTSPDGKSVAYVTKFTPCFDGPCQKLWLKRNGDKHPIMLEKLVDDTRWCDEIQWSPNGEKVAFLIMRRYLYIYDVSGPRLFREIDLIPGNKNYPSNPEVTGFSFSADGKEVKFKLTEFDTIFDAKKGKIVRKGPKNVKVRKIFVESEFNKDTS